MRWPNSIAQPNQRIADFGKPDAPVPPRPVRWLILTLQKKQNAQFVPCRNGMFAHKFANNVMALRLDDGATIVDVGPGTAPVTITFSRNYWYRLDQSRRTRRAVELPVEETGGVYDVDPEFVAPDKGVLPPRSQRAVRNAGARPEAPR